MSALLHCKIVHKRVRQQRDTLYSLPIFPYLLGRWKPDTNGVRSSAGPTIFTPTQNLLYLFLYSDSLLFSPAVLLLVGLE